MPLKTFATLDEIPDALRASAVETKDGKFAVAEDEDVAGLKAALAENREKRKAAEAALNKATEEMRNADLKDKGLLEAKQKWDAEILAPVTTRAAALEAENRTLKLVTPVKDALRNAGVIDPNDAWARYSDAFDLSEAGVPILKANPTADIGKWAASDLKAKHPHWFEGTKADGGGAGGGSGGTRPPKTIDGGDQKAFLSNIDGIAKGEVAVAL